MTIKHSDAVKAQELLEDAICEWERLSEDERLDVVGDAIWELKGRTP